MNNKKKIILISIIIAIILIMIIFGKLHNKKRVEDYNADFEPTDYNEEEYTVDSLERVNIRMDYYVVKNAIIQLYSNYDVLTSEYSTNGEISTAKNNIYNLLDANYKKDKGYIAEIKKEDFTSTYTYSLLINDMYYIQKDTNINVYIVYGTVGEISSTNRKNFKYVVSCDRQFNTYSIIPDTEYVESIGLGNVEVGEKYNLESFSQINRKGNINVYQEKYIYDDEYVNNLLLDIKSRLTVDREYTYDNMLIKEYKESKFPTIDDFISYCKTNIKEFVTLNFTAYNRSREENKTTYYCIDENNKSYTIVEVAPMKYKFQIE